MRQQIISYCKDFIHIIFPHNCMGCGNDAINQEDLLCINCTHHLPLTTFLTTANNPIEISLAARMPIAHAGAAFYYNNIGSLHNLIVALKYKQQKEAGLLLGKLLGMSLATSPLYQQVTTLVPLPLNERKELKRGYNQAAVIAEGIASVWPKEIVYKAVGRKLFTESQTTKNRVSRWQNMQEVFTVTDADALTNKHVLLIDDVITTGATIESCAREILAVPNVSLSIAAVAYTNH